MSIGSDIYNADIDSLRKMLIELHLNLGAAKLRIAELEEAIRQHKHSSKWDPIIGKQPREDGMSANSILWKKLIK